MVFRTGFSHVRRGFFQGLGLRCASLASKSLHFYTLLHLGVPAGRVTGLLGVSAHKISTTECQLHGGFGLLPRRDLASFLVGFG